jgi:exodeoxyribonuclease VII small subunit
MNKQPELTYESAFTELQQIVRDLQDESVGIDELTAKIARAAELIRFCRERLRMTEEEVAKLVGQ